MTEFFKHYLELIQENELLKNRIRYLSITVDDLLAEPEEVSG
jgi:hypothetical protein|tara:strand:- start:421 stop:546 length:126 start_codon:yes stop_codon:yes gene_type:complete